MTTQELMTAASTVTQKRNEIHKASQKIFWDSIKNQGLTNVSLWSGPDGGPHPRVGERAALITEANERETAGYEAAGVTLPYVIHNDIIVEATPVKKWNGRGHYQHRFYLLKGYKRNGEIKRGRFSMEKSIEKIG
jgi:hypothetical protein